MLSDIWWPPWGRTGAATSRAPRASPACAGTRPARRRGRSRTGARRGRGACRRSGCRLRASCIEKRFSPVASGAGVALGQLGLQRVVERVARLLVPAQPVRRERLGVGERGRRRSKRPLASTASRRPSPTTASTASIAPQVLGQRRAADLHLDRRCSPGRGSRASRPAGRARSLPGLVVAAGGVDPDALVGLAAAVAIGEEPPERLALDLGDGVPDGHVERRRPRRSARRGRPASRRSSGSPRSCGDRGSSPASSSRAPGRPPAGGG